jgi:hypothetical protein
MKNNLYRPSFKRGRRMVENGCPLPYLDHLPRTLGTMRKALRVSLPRGGYFTHWAWDLCPLGGTGYFVGLHLATELPSGVIISEWRFCSPWPDHFISWGMNLPSFVRRREPACDEKGFNSELLDVLDDRWPITPGHSVEGFLCGTALEAMPESVAHRGSALATLNLLANTGHSLSLSIPLSIDRSAKVPSAPATTRRRRPLLAERDLVAGESRTQDREFESEK